MSVKYPKKESKRPSCVRQLRTTLAQQHGTIPTPVFIMRRIHVGAGLPCCTLLLNTLCQEGITNENFYSWCSTHSYGVSRAGGEYLCSDMENPGVKKAVVEVMGGEPPHKFVDDSYAFVKP